MLAAEFGATWEDVVGTLVLTQPSFGLVPALGGADPGPDRASSRALADADADAGLIPVADDR